MRGEIFALCTPHPSPMVPPDVCIANSLDNVVILFSSRGEGFMNHTYKSKFELTYAA
ncbi:MAG: hypothetical protein IJD73_04790 [Clostridia bacterium]|nr:hypothetical protein [Clostridia bacterium]